MESTSCARLYWPFSLEVYLSPGISEICLQFQDELGVDVNVFLLCLLGSKLKKKPLSLTEIRQLDALGKHWREEVVKALRAIRRRLKKGPKPAPTPHTNKLREEVKRLELEAEKIQQEEIAKEIDAILSRQPAAVRQGMSPISWQGLYEVAKEVLYFYAQENGVRNKGLLEDMLKKAELVVNKAWGVGLDSI